jgi:hypothetical protein
MALASVQRKEFGPHPQPLSEGEGSKVFLCSSLYRPEPVEGAAKVGSFDKLRIAHELDLLPLRSSIDEQGFCGYTGERSEALRELCVSEGCTEEIVNL